MLADEPPSPASSPTLAGTQYGVPNDDLFSDYTDESDSDDSDSDDGSGYFSDDAFEKPRSTAGPVTISHQTATTNSIHDLERNECFKSRNKRTVLGELRWSELYRLHPKELTRSKPSTSCPCCRETWTPHQRDTVSQILQTRQNPNIVELLQIRYRAFIFLLCFN